MLLVVVLDNAGFVSTFWTTMFTMLFKINNGSSTKPRDMRYRWRRQPTYIDLHYNNEMAAVGSQQTQYIHYTTQQQQTSTTTKQPKAGQFTRTIHIDILSRIDRSITDMEPERASPLYPNMVGDLPAISLTGPEGEILDFWRPGDVRIEDSIYMDAGQFFENVMQLDGTDEIVLLSQGALELVQAHTYRG